MLERNQVKREWQLLQKQEARFLKRQAQEQESFLGKTLQEKIPDQLQDTLHKAFHKAFMLVFDKGTGVIERTYKKEEYEQNYKVREFAMGLQANKKNIKAFSKQAGASRTKNLLVSGAEGVGLGVLGIGLPDIPVFTAVLLKSIYEIALSYGYSYQTEEEQCFILTVIRTSMQHGEQLHEANHRLNEWIDQEVSVHWIKAEELEKAAEALAEELLYMKFLQGLPVVGAAGGIWNAWCLKKVTGYADLKYRRRFCRSIGGAVEK